MPAKIRPHIDRASEGEPKYAVWEGDQWIARYLTIEEAEAIQSVLTEIDQKWTGTREQPSTYEVF